MPKIIKYITISFCLLLIIISVFLFIRLSELKSEYFNNGSEAQNSATAKGGWIPAWLPSNATEIYIQYNLDTNYRWLKFRLENKLKNDFISNFKKISFEDAKDIFTSGPRGTKWWFRGLIQQQPANDSALNAYFYIGNGTNVSKDVYLAVSRTDDSLYFWIERP